MQSTPEIQTRVLKNFQDPLLNTNIWNYLLESGETDTIFLTKYWQKTWWNCFGRGKLLIILVQKEIQPVAMAPLFAQDGMIFFNGSGGSDYLDFIGDTSDPDILKAILSTAKNATPDFLGFRFYHIPKSSQTGRRLKEAAAALDLYCFLESEMPAPFIDLSIENAGIDAANRKSLLRHERYFSRNGQLKVLHFSESEKMVGLMEDFFNQHIGRWKNTPYPSLFLDPAKCQFYRQIAKGSTEVPWLRFTMIEYAKKPIAFHFGFSYKAIFLWYKPSFDISLAKRSPGEVLLRQLFLAALEENAKRFDFGLGDEAFKQRFANATRFVQTWGLYPVSKKENHL